MKSIIRYGILIISCLLIAIGTNLLIIPNEFLSFGINGLSILIYYVNNVPPAINIFLINMIIIILASLVLNRETIKTYLLPAILIPLFIFLTADMAQYIHIALEEKIMVAIIAGAIGGYGYSLIYKQGFSGGTIFLLEELIGKRLHFHSKIYSWIIDIVILALAFVILGPSNMLYSAIIIVISKYMITKARFGISDSKMFYIITSKEKEVRDYIIHDLKYELTVLDSKGGFSKKKSHILLTVISTSDYYRLKEGIKLIDDKAFIAITDTYDVVNRKRF